MFDREIDRTIDDVAREMTAGDAAANLRARVLARIDHVDDRRQARPMVVAVAAALMVVVIGAAAVMILRTRITETTATKTTTTETTPPIVATTTTTPANAGQPTPRVPRPVTRPHRRPRAVDTTPSDVAALAPPPLDVESIALGALEPPPSIEVEQLETIAPIAIAPLGEGDRR
jgi:hypothetical protein